MEDKTNFNHQPDPPPENVVRRSAIEEARKVHPNIVVPDGVRIVDDDDLKDVSIVISARWSLQMELMMATIPHRYGQCYHCGHRVIISESSPKGPLTMCTQCAIEEGKVKREWLGNV